jgi:hypothetical protein
MSFKHVSLALVAVLMGSACTKSATDSPAPVAIPDKPVLNQPQSQPLSLPEYNTFRNFVATEEPLASFTPQDYIFAQLNETGLSQPQQDLLGRIRSSCQNPKEDHEPDHSQPINVGSVLVTTHSKKSSGPTACPLIYGYDETISLTVVAGSAQQVVMTGTGAIKENLTLTDWSVAPTVGTNQISGDANASIAYILNQTEERMRISIGGHQIVGAFSSVNQPGHSEELSADNISVTKLSDGTKTSLVAFNATINVPNLPKAVVVSLAGSVTSVQGSPVITPTEFYVNHEPIPVVDQNALLNSRVMKQILKQVVGEAHGLKAKVGAAALATARAVVK